MLDEAELLLIAVAPAARRRGVGAALLRAVIAEARGHGVTKLHLEVRAGNTAIQLYAAAGSRRWASAAAITGAATAVRTTRTATP